MGSDLKVPESPPFGTGPPYVLISFIIALSSLAPQATEREMRAEKLPTAWCRAKWLSRHPPVAMGAVAVASVALLPTRLF